MKIGLRIIAVIVLGVFSYASTSSDTNDTQSIKNDNAQSLILDADTLKEAEKLVCDGKIVKSNCTLDGVDYETYIYHPAVPEKSHIETITTYKEEIVGYCTRCVDGTYSPSCATGRGACSWHGGVAQWNAPVYNRVPVYTKKKVIDSPAKKAFYEKVVQ